MKSHYCIYHFFRFSFRSLTRLGKMKLQWRDLPYDVRKRLVTDLEASNGQYFTRFYFSTLLTGCEWLGYRWAERKDTRDAMFSAFTNAFSGNQESASIRQFMPCIFSFSRNEVRWKSLSKDTKTTVLKEIDRFSDEFSSLNLKTLLYG
jgi:hypothetical protein